MSSIALDPGRIVHLHNTVDLPRLLAVGGYCVALLIPDFPTLRKLKVFIVGINRRLSRAMRDRRINKLRGVKSPARFVFKGHPH